MRSQVRSWSTALLVMSLTSVLLVSMARPAAADPSLVSLNRPTSSSGTGAALANDADPTNAGGYFDSELLGGKNAWWQVDLGATYALDTVVNRNYVDGTRYYHYYVRGSLDGVHWSAPIAWKFNDAPAADAGETFSVTGVARYVRVNIIADSANTSAHLTDFKVYGTPIAETTAPGVAVTNVATGQDGYASGSTPSVGYTLTNTTGAAVTVQKVYAIVWGLSSPTYRRFVTAETNVSLTSGASHAHTASLWAVDSGMPTGAYGVYLRVELSDGRSWEQYQTFFRVVDPTVLTRYDVSATEYAGFPVYQLRGGLGPEYAVLKSAQVLSQSAGPSWTPSRPGYGPEPVRATPHFLSASIDETIATLDGALGSTRPFDTVVISSSIQSAPYLTRTLQAPVLPMQYLVSFDSVHELDTVLSAANAAGYPSYATMGFDGSMDPGVAWIKLLGLPPQYRDFLSRHGVHNVIFAGSSGTAGGENASRKVLVNGSATTGNNAGDIYAIYPGGGTPSDVAALNQRVADFSDLPLTSSFADISDWEAGLVPEQTSALGTAVKAIPGIRTVAAFTAGSYYDIDNMGPYVTAAFYRKNQAALGVDGQVIRGVALSPYLLAHPFEESTRGLLPVLFFQGESGRTIVEGRILNIAQSAVDAYFPGVDLRTLPVYVETSRNFGGFANQTIAQNLTTYGFGTYTLGDTTTDERWDPSDGFNAWNEKAVQNLAATRTQGQWTTWNSALAALTPADLFDIASRFPGLTYTVL